MAQLLAHKLVNAAPSAKKTKRYWLKLMTEFKSVVF